MKRFSLIILSAAIAFNLTGLNTAMSADNPAETEKILKLDGAIMTHYLLGSDTADVKDKDEAIYLTKGDAKSALIILKDILIEHKSPRRSFSRRDLINIIIFRGVLPKLGQIELIKVASKGNSFEVYVKYIDMVEPAIPSQPAAIIPVGKLPKGKYSVVLYVDSQLRKKTEFKVN